MRIAFSKRAFKQVLKAPQHVQTKLKYWLKLVEERGLAEARKIPGFHDEPLKGRRWGQRSIRLSRSWRAIYVVDETIEIREVHKHDY